MCPLAGGAIGSGTGLGRGLMVCHCLVVETPKDGLVLIDTGWGTRECREPTVLPGYFRRLVGPTLDPRETARAQVIDLGFTPSDVRHVVVTHLDLDHAGGLADFPAAAVHLHQRELDAATARATRAERSRYLPHQWSHRPRWSPVAETGDTWRGLPAVRKLPGLDADVGLVPLHGHTRGHSGVVVGTGDRWLLHAGDAYFHHRELERGGRAPVALRAFQSIIEMDRHARHASQDSLRRLRADHPDVTVVSAHDPAELTT
jgi:glyoxylase-like metal-dependent hydrolase (beta-lactamase superfamily II)